MNSGNVPLHETAWHDLLRREDASKTGVGLTGGRHSACAPPESGAWAPYPGGWCGGAGQGGMRGRIVAMSLVAKARMAKARSVMMHFHDEAVPVPPPVR